MSLKGFHIFFIGVSLIFALGVGFWGVRDFRAHDDRLSLYMGVGSFVGALVLAVYGAWFLRKLRNFSIA